MLAAEPFRDEQSGSIVFRDVIIELLQLLDRQPIDVVLFHRTDRIGRRGRVQDTIEAEIMARGPRIEYITATYDHSTPQGRVMRRMQGVLDEYNYEELIDKLKSHKKEAARHGSVIGSRPPFGYRIEKRKDERGRKIAVLVVDDKEAEIVVQIFRWYAYDGLTIRQIVARLTEMRVKTRHDTMNFKRTRPAGSWNVHGLHLLLKRETYIGTWHYGRTQCVPDPKNPDRTIQVPVPREQWIAVKVDPIIDDETWAHAQARLTYNFEHSKRNRKHEYLFTGMIKCAACSERLGKPISMAGKHSTKRARSYRCAMRVENLCNGPEASENVLRAELFKWIVNVVADPEFVAQRLRERAEHSERENKLRLDAIARIDANIAEVESEQAEVMKLRRRKLLSDDRWYREDQECIARIAELNKQRQVLDCELVAPVFKPEYIANVKAACERVRGGLEHHTVEEQRQTLEDLGLRVYIRVADGVKYADVECIFDEKKLIIGGTSSRRMGTRDIVYTSS